MSWREIAMWALAVWAMLHVSSIASALEFLAQDRRGRTLGLYDPEPEDHVSRAFPDEGDE